MKNPKLYGSIMFAIRDGIISGIETTEKIPDHSTWYIKQRWTSENLILTGRVYGTERIQIFEYVKKADIIRQWLPQLQETFNLKDDCKLQLFGLTTTIGEWKNA